MGFSAPGGAAAQDETFDAQGAVADPPGRVGRVAVVTGTVRTVDADGQWTALQRNQPLTTGDQVFSDVGGRAVLQIGSSTVRLGENSGVTFTRLDDEQVRLRFDHGSLALRVRSSDVLGEFVVETDEGEFLPQHPGYFRFDREPGQAVRAMAWSGDLLLQAHDSALPIAAQQRAEVWQEGDQKVTHYRMLAIPVDDFSEWALADDRLDDKALADTSGGTAVPAEMTGAADLSQYGHWATSTDYGSVWYPSSVYVGWAPYTYGYWNWVGPWGWTWIDYAPWGFAPYHYGRWVWIGGHWAWCPGTWGPRPVYAPALVGWVGGAGFVAGGHPMVGWVPLAPNEPYYPGYPVSSGYWSNLNGHAPPTHRPTPIGARPRVIAPAPGPVTYANRSVQGAVSIASAQALSSRQPMPAQRPAAQAKLIETVLAGKAQTQAPPAPPPGRSFAPRPGLAPAAALATGRGASGRPVQGGQPGASPGTGAAPPARATTPAAPAHGGPARGGRVAALPANGLALRTSGHAPAGGGAMVIVGATTTVAQPVPLANPNAPVPLANPNAPVPLVNPNAPVPLVNPNAPVPLVSQPQTRTGTPILVRTPSRGSASTTSSDANGDDGGATSNGHPGPAPAMAAPPGAFGFMGARGGGGFAGGGARGGHQ
jgi:hypothetical protein